MDNSHIIILNDGLEHCAHCFELLAGCICDMPKPVNPDEEE